MKKFSFKHFQLDDTARAALRDGVIFSQEPGLGKTLESLAWALIKEARRILLVVPGHLHQQFRNEARDRFGYHVTTLSHRQQIKSFSIDRPLSSVLRPRFFITTFHALGYNHTADGSPSLAACLAALPAGRGFDCVIVDEGTRLQSGDTHISQGVRTLQPKFRMILTGTPVKNRLESLFWLASWAAEAEPGLWPYPATDKGRARFASEHLVMAREVAGGRSEPTARVTNIHHLWKILAPLVIRRRKSNCGEAIPKKIVRHIRLQPGTAQAVVYQNHLRYPPLVSQAGRLVSGFGQVAMQLNYLRLAALAPHDPGLGRIHSAALGPKVSWSDFNPKLAACLSLIARLVRKGEQVAIGSPFHSFSEALHARLTEAGVSALLLDGRVSPADRGDFVEEFKAGRWSTGIFGLASMAEGSSLETCAHLILPARSWAYDENAQFVDRVWRINSPKPVTIYCLSIIGTIDERLEWLFDEKSSSAQLALDRSLFVDSTEDIDLGLLLRQAIKSFQTTHETLDEHAMAETWETSLRKKLTGAEARYQHLRSRSPNFSKPNNLIPLPTPSHCNKEVSVDWKHARKMMKKHAIAA